MITRSTDSGSESGASDITIRFVSVAIGGH